MHFHREPIEARLAKLADAGRTGVLRVAGDLGGAFYLRDGGVVFAESQRTPGSAMMPADSPDYLRGGAGPGSGEATEAPARPHDDPSAGDVAVVGSPALRSLERDLAVREATLDAALDLLSDRVRSARFRQEETPPVPDGAGMSFAALLGEVARRRAIVKQLSPLLGPDSLVRRNPRFDADAVQISALQWALTIRVRDGSTPRGLALEMGHSVFGTTIEVFRMIALGLLSAGEDPDWSAARLSEWSPGRARGSLSFIRAVTGERDR